MVWFTHGGEVESRMPERDEDNVYLNRAIVDQILNDLSEKKRESSRKVTCLNCKQRFVPVPNEDDIVKCPNCGQSKESDEG